MVDSLTMTYVSMQCLGALGQECFSTSSSLSDICVHINSNKWSEDALKLDDQ